MVKKKETKKQKKTTSHSSSQKHKPVRKKKTLFKPSLQKDISQHDLTSIEQITNMIFGRDSRIARSLRIFWETRRGFLFLRQYRKSATFFGSARDHLPPRMYTEATQLARMLADDNYAIITGGGGGIMEAANKGAFESGGRSVGLNIELKNGQRQNVYINEGMPFHYFFIRKLMLAFSSKIYIFFPGGFGTMDEFFEIVTLIQTEKIEDPIPVVVVGKEFWSPLLEWVDNHLYERFGTISRDDQKIYTLVDSAEEAYKVLLQKKKSKKK